MRRFFSLVFSGLLVAALTPSVYAHSLQDKKAPNFSLKNQDGKVFSLNERAGKGWTVLYFYPKAATPGCTKQACAFRDAIKVIKAQNAEVYGISADTVEDQKKFHAEHHLSFDLLADADGKVIELYDVKMAVSKMAKRQTFLIAPDLTVRQVFEDVDPALDAKNVADALVALQKSKTK